jgi:2-iminobutanoate/2-iminopropanoate deaminase
MMQSTENTSTASPDAFSGQAVTVSKGLIFISSVLPITPKSNTCVSGGLREQLEQAFENLRAILNNADSDLEHLVSIQILVPDKESLQVVNEVYSRILKFHKPARSIIPCGSVYPEALVEVNAVAMVSPTRVSVKWYQQAAQFGECENGEAFGESYSETYYEDIRLTA